MNKKIRNYTIWGAIFTILAGSLLHFVFAWSGNWHPAALIAAVNESTWEHLKLAFWPIFFFSLFEYFMYGKNVKNFCVSKALLVMIPPIIIVGLFYGYTAIISDNFIFDISIFIISVIIGYWINYLIMKSEKNYSKYNWLAYIIITVFLAKFSLFTYYSPNMFLFKDPISGGYGIQ